MSEQMRRFRDAQARTQRQRDNARWIAGLDSLQPRVGARIASVTRSGFGDREISLSEYHPRFVVAVKQCGRRGPRADWDSKRRVWIVPVSVWSCFREALRAHGFEIEQSGAADHG